MLVGVLSLAADNAVEEVTVCATTGYELQEIKKNTTEGNRSVVDAVRQWLQHHCVEFLHTETTIIDF